ncbi:MAG: prepilin-type N-terminal cleavage/methylation domain-containing protein, partial [Terriglobales bacterium]
MVRRANSRGFTLVELMVVI